MNQGERRKGNKNLTNYIIENNSEARKVPIPLTKKKKEESGEKP